MSSTANIHKHLIRCVGAMEKLFSEGYLEGAITLWYAYIDHMAWLSTSADDVNPKDFKEWVKNYILPTGRVNCDADDLWAARNGLLHMGNAEARDVKSGKACRIYYYSGQASPDPTAIGTAKLVNVKELIFSFMEGSLEFVEILRNDPAQLAVANEKAKKMLRYIPQ